MMESELGDEEVHVTLLTVRGRVKAVRFVTRLGQRELLEFTEDEQKGSWGGEPSEVQRKGSSTFQMESKRFPMGAAIR